MSTKRSSVLCFIFIYILPGYFVFHLCVHEIEWLKLLSEKRLHKYIPRLVFNITSRSKDPQRCYSFTIFNPETKFLNFFERSHTVLRVFGSAQKVGWKILEHRLRGHELQIIFIACRCLTSSIVQHKLFKKQTQLTKQFFSLPHLCCCQQSTLISF